MHKPMSALPPIATAKADMGGGRAVRTKHAPAVPWGEVVWTANCTPKYAGLPCTTSREFCCSSTPSATASFDGLRRATVQSDLGMSALPLKADMCSAISDVR
jgi:hypothetical protein